MQIFRWGAVAQSEPSNNHIAGSAKLSLSVVLGSVWVTQLLRMGQKWTHSVLH